MYSKSVREISYSAAINEALIQVMELNPKVFLIGQGVRSPWYVGQTCRNLIEKFTENRVIDTPVSENAVTGAAVGAAISGTRPIVVHPRVDFMMYALDPIINEAANWYYMSGGQASVPLVVWGIINRGGEQAAQHSQSLQATFAHIPGLKVVMPSNPYDAKGLLVAAVNDPNPVVYLDDRWLYNNQGTVPAEIYEVPIGKGQVVYEGKDCTVVSSSFLLQECLSAAKEIDRHLGKEIEVVDLRTVKPLDRNLITASIRKTGRLMVVDGGWRSFGVAAEICAIAAEDCWDALKAPVQRLTLPDLPAPASSTLEQNYYISREMIVKAIKSILVDS